MLRSPGVLKAYWSFGNARHDLGPADIVGRGQADIAEAVVGECPAGMAGGALRLEY
jgi:hypothetical protein